MIYRNIFTNPKIINTVLIILFCHSNILASIIEEVENLTSELQLSKISPFIQYKTLSLNDNSQQLIVEDTEVLSKHDISFVEQSLNDLQNNAVGSKLLKLLNARLIQLNKNVTIRKGSHHLFYIDKNEEFIIELALKSLEENNYIYNDQICCLGHESENSSYQSYFEIGSSETPFYITLGHELIHLKHYLEDPELYKNCLRIMDFSFWDIYSSQERGLKIWTKLEEQRTVIGPDKNDICELTLRISGKLMPRYAYQESSQNFYEERNIIYSILNKHNLNLGSLTCMKWQFDSSIACISSYNSDSFKSLYAQGYIKDAKSVLDAVTAEKNKFEAEQKKLEKRKEAMMKKLADRKKK